MKVEFQAHWPISKLVPADYNPRRITPEAFVELQKSIRHFGVVKPVILNKDGTIVAGHQRIKAMKAVGLTETPAMILPIKVPRNEEIRFNLMHNSIETCDVVSRVNADISFGYTFVSWHDIVADRTADSSGAVIAETSKLVAKYGSWGSVIAAEDGRIVANADYAAAAHNLHEDVLVYKMKDSEIPAMLDAFSVNYGSYFYQSLNIPGYHQMQAQLNRLRGERDEEGNLLPHSTDVRSHIYEQLVIPLLEQEAPARPRMVDFGAGRCDYAKMLQAEGFPIIAYEPHLRIEGREAVDVRGIVASLRRLGRDVEANGLYPVVILDSVLNSVTTLEFEDAVLTTVNALCAIDGRCFTNCRSLERTRALAKAGTSGTGRRLIEFLDGDNFSATYHNDMWTIQHFHGKDEFAELCSHYFGSVRHTGSDNYHRFELRDPLPLGESAYFNALDAELNMVLPGGKYHGRHEHVRDAIVAAAVARDAGRVTVA